MKDTKTKDWLRDTIKSSKTHAKDRREINAMYPSHEKLSDRETKIFVKQAISNYLILLLQDV